MFLIFQERIERGTFVKKKGGVDVIWYNVKYTWILLLIMPKDKEETFQLSKNIFVVKMLMPSHCRIFFFWTPTSFSSSLVKIYIKNWNGVKNKKWKWYITIYCTCTIHFFFSIHVIYNGVWGRTRKKYMYNLIWYVDMFYMTKIS